MERRDGKMDLSGLLMEIAALGTAVDALGVWSEHSGCTIDAADLMAIGVMIRGKAKEAQECLENEKEAPSP